MRVTGEKAIEPIVACPQCGRGVSVSEPYAFRGMDRLRSTLSCGHVVLREQLPQFDPWADDDKGW